MSKQTKAQKSVKADRVAEVNVPQTRILQVLAKAKGAMTADALAKKAKVARSWVVVYVYQACALNKTQGLCEQGLAKAKTISAEDSETGRPVRTYEITPKGAKLAKSLSA